MKASFRVDRKGTANHNDRNFDYHNDEHIINEKVKDNIYITEAPELSFLEFEKKFYKDNFSAALDAQNEKHRKQRQYSRVKSIDQLYESRKTCPQEIILQIGSKKDPYTDKDTFRQIVEEYIEQFEYNYGDNCKILDAAIHLDEESIHAHVRRVWFIETDVGKQIAQNEAMRQLGFERPLLDHGVDKYNNPTVSFTEADRKSFVNICREHGVQIDKVTSKPVRQAVPILQKKRELISEDIEALQDEVNKSKEQIMQLGVIEKIIKSEEPELILDILSKSTVLEKENVELRQELEEVKIENDDLAAKLQQIERELSRMKKERKRILKVIEKNAELKKQYEEAIGISNKYNPD